MNKLSGAGLCNIQFGCKEKSYSNSARQNNISAYSHPLLNFIVIILYRTLLLLY